MTLELSRFAPVSDLEGIVIMLSQSSALALPDESSLASFLTHTVRPLPQVDRFRQARLQLIHNVRARVGRAPVSAPLPAPVTLNEELANSLTHVVGLIAAVAGGLHLFTTALANGDAWQAVGCGVFALTLALLYGASTLYHSIQDEQSKEWFRIGDHACIYLLIAGTYTPFLVTFMRGAWGYSLLALVWVLAATGVANKVKHGCGGKLSTALYIAMGWIIVLAIKPALAMIPSGALVWLVAGGVSYTAGVWFFVQDRKPYYHAVWHMFVLGGSVCHFAAVASYVAPIA